MTTQMALRSSVCTTILLITLVPAVLAQPAGDAPAGGDAPAFKQEELDQMLAPLALYPDSLIAQILMAATYPLEVVEADRWAKAHPNMKADALTTAMEANKWDPSVKSLVNFPDVLAMMSEQLDWTTSLGDAFLSQQKQVMDTIQRLRGKAQAEGNLKTTEQQVVTVQQEAQSQVIVIEPAQPEVIYVPSYNPTVVYGSWPYPTYPPYPYHPPGYGYAATAAVSFGLGVACGAAWGYAWGGCNWGHGDIDIDCNRNTFVNNRIDRSRYSNRQNFQGGRGTWQHDPGHRQGAAYRDQASARKYGGKSSADAAKARDSFRGRADAGRQDIARGGADQFKSDPARPGSAQNRPGGAGGADRPGSANRPGTADRPSGDNRPGAADRPQTTDRGSGGKTGDRPTTADRSRPSQNDRGGAFDGAGKGNAKAQSQRGQASRSPARSPSGGSGSRGGGARGGASRGGGGRR